MTTQRNPIHAAIDDAYARFVAQLPDALVAIARDLPHRLGLTPNPGTPWSRVFNNAAVLGFPALLLSEERVPAELRERAIEAHLFAIIAAFGMDRIEDGQITVDAEERALIDRVRLARDEALAPLVERAPEGAVNFAWGERLTAESVASEREVFAGRAPATFERYREVSWSKQGLAFPATLTAAAAARWSAEERRHVEALVAGAALGLQYRDDVVDWMDDLAAGASWPVLMLERGRAAATAEEAERQLHTEGMLVRLLRMSSEAFRDAGNAASALGATALAAWAFSQAQQTEGLAKSEAECPGFAVRWERERRERREREQAALAAPAPAA